MLYQLSIRKHMNLSVLHARAPMYTLAHDVVGNGYTLRFGRKSNEPRTFELTVSGLQRATIKSDDVDATDDGKLTVCRATFSRF
jgi:polyferredoxin